MASVPKDRRRVTVFTCDGCGGPSGRPYARPMSSVDRAPLQLEAIIAATRQLIISAGSALTLRRLAATLGSPRRRCTGTSGQAGPAAGGGRGRVRSAPRPVRRGHRHRPGGASAPTTTPTWPTPAHPETFRVMFLFAPDLAGAGDCPRAWCSRCHPGVTAAAGAVTEAVETGALTADDPLLVALALWSTVTAWPPCSTSASVPVERGSRWSTGARPVLAGYGASRPRPARSWPCPPSSAAGTCRRRAAHPHVGPRRR